MRLWRSMSPTVDKGAMKAWWGQIREWRARKCLAFRNSGRDHQAAYASPAAVRGLEGPAETYITTEVGQHQMWAAQYFGFGRAQPLD